MKYRGIYLNERLNPYHFKDENKLKNARIFTSVLYLFFGFGIMFNYFTFFLMLVLDPLPDKIIFEFINFHDMIDPRALSRIEDVEAALYPHEKTIFYATAFISFTAFAQIVACFHYLTKGSKKDHVSTALKLLISSVIDGILVGFTTFMPLFIS
ncbi:MAG: hypothetical protein ACTSYC_03955 [Promethearchaeota archaeon]